MGLLTYMGRQKVLIKCPTCKGSGKLTYEDRTLKARKGDERLENCYTCGGSCLIDMDND